jgi:hypothetical protein
MDPLVILLDFYHSPLFSKEFVLELTIKTTFMGNPNNQSYNKESKILFCIGLLV